MEPAPKEKGQKQEEASENAERTASRNYGESWEKDWGKDASQAEEQEWENGSSTINKEYFLTFHHPTSLFRH